MAVTTAEIRTRAAQKLGLLGTGQTLQSAIADDLDDAYIEVFGMIEGLGLASWGTSTANVPDALTEPIVSWVAGIRATRYDIPPERYRRVIDDYLGNPARGTPSAKDRIRAVQAPPAIGPTKFEDF